MSEHEHHHEHDEHCGCGHEHHHEHDEHCSCGHDHEHHHHEEEKLPGVIYTQVKLHDDAKVVSGSLNVTGDYASIRDGLSRGLKAFADGITELGGVIGHIKASARTIQTEMFSITDTEVMVKSAPEQQVEIILAAIVFFVTEEQAEQLGRKALECALGAEAG